MTGRERKRAREREAHGLMDNWACPVVGVGKQQLALQVMLFAAQLLHAYRTHAAQHRGSETVQQAACTADDL